MRENGEVVFSFVFHQGKIAIYTIVNDKVSPMFMFTGVEYDYSSIQISEDRVYFIMKEYASIQIIQDNKQGIPLLTYINK